MGTRAETQFPRSLGHLCELSGRLHAEASRQMEAALKVAREAFRPKRKPLPTAAILNWNSKKQPEAYLSLPKLTEA